jgi:5-methylthioadenosine/S-adenosylhomocysteine deaminase
MATLNGARALGFEDVAGSLVPGKDADVDAVDLGGVATQPVFDPVSHLVNVAERGDVSDVWVRGRRMVASGSLTALDEAAILAKTRIWQHKLQA